MQSKNYYNHFTSAVFSTYNTFYNIFSSFRLSVLILDRLMILSMISAPSPNELSERSP